MTRAQRTIIRAAALVSAAVVSIAPLRANCGEFGGFAIFQCADRAWFLPPPTFNPSNPGFDPNGRATAMTPLFWQIGFGNASLNTGAGTSGTGVTASAFNGNDSGLFAVDVQDARAALGGDPNVPYGSVCLGNNNWGVAGVDGCCDNPRDTGSLMPGGVTDDDVLNPYYDVSSTRNGDPGRYSLLWIQDYPMAVLLKEPAGAFFAAAAVASMDRGNDGSGNDGPCAASAADTNPAPCDTRRGVYELKAVKDARTNPVTGLMNVVPWQKIPQPAIVTNDQVSPGDPNSARQVTLDWDGVVVHGDERARASANPTLAPQDPNRSPGVGVLDVGPLLRYLVDEAPVVLDANGQVNEAALSFSPVTETTAPGATVTVPLGACYRLRTAFGRKPEAVTPSAATCRVGRCGDVGYEVASGVTCFEGSPSAVAGADVVVSCAGATTDVILEGSESFDQAATINSFQWRIGGTLLGATSSFQHGYPLGRTIVTLRVGNNQGRADTDTVAVTVVDDDLDNLCGAQDNCPGVANANQADSDFDGLGDACDVCRFDVVNDADADLVCGNVDNCPTVYNPFQGDGDGDGFGNLCDPCPADVLNDADGDMLCESSDNCPADANPLQEDTDGDGHGDACDTCQSAYNPSQSDSDADAVGDVCDNCPAAFNPTQPDLDGDGKGDACDLTVTSPEAGDSLLDCAAPPTIRWLPEIYDRFRVFVSWDPNFAGKRKITSGDTLLKTTSWTMPLKKWRKACANAGPDLYIKVFGKDIATRGTSFSSVVTVCAGPGCPP